MCTEILFGLTIVEADLLKVNGAAVLHEAVVQQKCKVASRFVIFRESVTGRCVEE